jgi:hypothetical protein
MSTAKSTYTSRPREEAIPTAVQLSSGYAGLDEAFHDVGDPRCFGGFCCTYPRYARCLKDHVAVYTQLGAIINFDPCNERT